MSPHGICMNVISPNPLRLWSEQASAITLARNPARLPLCTERLAPSPAHVYGNSRQSSWGRSSPWSPDGHAHRWITRTSLAARRLTVLQVQVARRGRRDLQRHRDEWPRPPQRTGLTTGCGQGECRAQPARLHTPGPQRGGWPSDSPSSARTWLARSKEWLRGPCGTDTADSKLRCAARALGPTRPASR